MPLVSVIITTKDEAVAIENCLVSVKEQTYKNIEIIVVDNYSGDDTVKIARRYTNFVFSKGPERSAQRNFGMLIKSRGKYLMYIDADMSLSRGLIKEAVEMMEMDDSLGGLYVPLRWVGQNWIIQAKGFEREFYDGTCLDAVRFVRRETVKKTGGFDERLYAGEDWDLNERIKQISKVSSIKSIMYHHEDEKISLKDYISKSFYYSRNMEIYIQKYKRNETVRKQFNIIYRYFTVFVENGKWKMLLHNPGKAIKMIFLKIIVGLVFLMRKKYK